MRAIVAYLGTAGGGVAHLAEVGGLPLAQLGQLRHSITLAAWRTAINHMA